MKLKPLLILLLTALPVFARLGETKAECEARYGKPVRTTMRSGNPIYLKGVLQIIIGFLNDKATFILFNKLEPGTKASDLPVGIADTVPLSEAEMNVLLQANAGTFKWTRQPDHEDPDIAWALSDGKCHATYVDQCLEVRNQPAYEEWIADRNLRRAAGIPSLGESKAELEKRCGMPIKTYSDGSLAYQKGSFKIVATFWNDKAASLSFESAQLEKALFAPDKWRASALYGDEIKAILQGSAANSEWKQSEADEDLWNRADKKAHATYDMDDYVLSIVDEEFYQHELAKEKKEATEEFKDFGALGMSKPECEKLFGKPIKALADGQIAYHKAGIAILVTFWQDKAAQLVLFKIDAQEPDADVENRKSIFGAEREAILKANSNGGKWIEGEESDDGTTTSLRNDRKAVAVYDSGEKTLTLYDRAYIDNLGQDPDDQKPKALDGF